MLAEILDHASKRVCWDVLADELTQTLSHIGANVSNLVCVRVERVPQLLDVEP